MYTYFQAIAAYLWIIAARVETITLLVVYSVSPVRLCPKQTSLTFYQKKSEVFITVLNSLTQGTVKGLPSHRGVRCDVHSSGTRTHSSEGIHRRKTVI